MDLPLKLNPSPSGSTFTEEEYTYLVLMTKWGYKTGDIIALLHKSHYPNRTAEALVYKIIEIKRALYILQGDKTIKGVSKSMLKRIKAALVNKIPDDIKEYRNDNAQLPKYSGGGRSTFPKVRNPVTPVKAPETPKAVLPEPIKSEEKPIERPWDKKEGKRIPIEEFLKKTRANMLTPEAVIIASVHACKEAGINLKLDLDSNILEFIIN